MPGEYRVDLTGVLRSELNRARETHDKAVATGDGRLAAEQAEKCARILRRLAEQPSEPDPKYYLEAAKKWDERADSIKKRGLERPQERPRESDSEMKRPGLEFGSYIEGLISTSDVTWDDIGGLGESKRLLQETVVIDAMKKPESIKPWRGILLYGPPGTGKTLMASAAAGTLKATFFNVSADKVLSKYFGESSRLIAALYEVALARAPSIVFIDELDALTLSRSKDIDESSRRVLSTLLAQLDGFKSKKSNRLVLTLAATNSPWDMDAAALERFPRRIYVPLPDEKAAAEIARICVKGLDASGINFDSIARECTKRLFSGRDINNLCQQAVWNMIRDENKNLHELSKLDFEELANRALKTRPLREADFSVAFDNIKVSPKSKNLERYMKWAEDFGG